VIELEGIQSHVLVRCIERFRTNLERELGEALANELRGFRPAELRELFEELDVVTRQLAVRNTVFSQAPSEPWPATSVHGVHSRLLKRVVVTERRTLAQDIDAPRQKTTHREAIMWLERELRVLDQIMQAEWFLDARPARVPRLTDYVSIRHAEAARPELAREPAREIDDKFRVLFAPSSFLPDLAWYRARCELRETAVTVAYLDIDDFKAFNTRWGETRVDRDLLPPFMELLEAHVFAHGHAYRLGGDEYVALLPNADGAWGLAFVRRFARALEDLRCPGIDLKPTISVGLVTVGPDSFLTDREVLARADRAKAFAKQSGKRRVAGYAGELVSERDLVVLEG
jgi:diguanylate cyclase (GGDEF)-like protein